MSGTFLFFMQSITCILPDIHLGLWGDGERSSLFDDLAILVEDLFVTGGDSLRRRRRRILVRDDDSPLHLLHSPDAGNDDALDQKG